MNIKEAERIFMKFQGRSLPKLMANTVNSLAFNAQKEARKIVKEKMVLRNGFTVKSLQVQMAQPSLKAVAKMGSVADWLKTQESGGMVGSKNGGPKSIPTTTASQEGRGVIPRRKTVARANYYSRSRGSLVRMNKGRRVRNRSQAFAVLIAMAKREGGGYFYQGRALYHFDGNKLSMVYDRSRQKVKVPKNEWLAPTLVNVEKVAEKIGRREFWRIFDKKMGKF